jgi:hypothetical protein
MILTEGISELLIARTFPSDDTNSIAAPVSRSDDRRVQDSAAQQTGPTSRSTEADRVGHGCARLFGSASPMTPP